jgi:hypothetical protein
MDGYGLRAGGDTSGGLDGNEIEVHIFLGIFVIVLRCSYLGLVHNFFLPLFLVVWLVDREECRICSCQVEWGWLGGYSRVVMIERRCILAGYVVWLDKNKMMKCIG